MIVEHDLLQLQTAVWDYYAAHGRHDLPWRLAAANGNFDPYPIMVSELMLQQTQVSRVIPKFLEFMELFPSLAALAAASTGEVLRAWSGLGYNRRAKFLQAAAQAVQTHYNGVIPQTALELVKLPGIGPNTAGAILAYACNQPALFIETNIRTVYIHHLFHDHDTVSDKEILAALQLSLDGEQPREWYWALMDYGSHLKKTVGNPNRLSSSYAKQSIFQGSRRQVRGQIIRLLGQQAATVKILQQHIDDERLQTVLDDLVTEKLISRQADVYSL